LPMSNQMVRREPEVRKYSECAPKKSLMFHGDDAVLVKLAEAVVGRGSLQTHICKNLISEFPELKELVAKYGELLGKL